MVTEFFTGLKSVIKPHTFSIDGIISKLHYRFTAGLLFLFCLLITSRQYFGDPIACQPSSKDEILPDVLNTYCWIHATFTLPSAHGKKVGDEVPHPGIDRSSKDEDRHYHRYYQWVWFVLLLQLMMFYLPHFLWKCLEHETIKKTILDLHLPVAKDQKERDKQCRMLAKYLRETEGTHTWYVLRYAFCEILNFVNVVGQIYMINAFLGGEFSTYGADVLRLSETDQFERFDPMVRIFPRVTKCLFHKFGPSGDIMRHDALCVLPLNIVNEKIYIVMWFWFVILAVVTGLWLLFLIPVLFWKKGRFYIFRGYSRYAERKYVSEFCYNSYIGDWFFMYLLCCNMDQVNFDQVLRTYCLKEFDEKDRDASKKFKIGDGHGHDSMA